MTAEHSQQPTGAARREPEDAQMQLVVADHVDELAPANHPARGAQVRRTPVPGWLLHLQVAQLAEAKGRKLFWTCALPIHGQQVPARGMPKPGPEANANSAGGPPDPKRGELG
jgi:hypothetical protein